MKKFSLFIFLLFSLLFSVRAQAFQYVYENSKKYEWQNNESAVFQISTNSLPEGSTRRDGVVSEMGEWEDVDGSDFNFRYTSSSNSDGQFIFGDGVSEIGFVSNASLEDVCEEAAACASVNTSWNLAYGYFIEEVDIIFADDDGQYIYGLPSYITTQNYPYYQRVYVDGEYLGYFRGSVVHELGHALGLGHTSDYGFMVGYAGNTTEHSGSNPWRPLPDDRQGIRDLYPSNSSETDMGLSNYELRYSSYASLYDFQSNFIEYTGLCPGDSFEATKTTLNNGNSTVSVDAEYYFSGNSTISSSDILVKSSTITVGAQNHYTNTTTLTVPSGTSYGTTYYVGLIIDPDNTVSEKYGSNNRMVLGSVAIDEESACTSEEGSIPGGVRASAVHATSQPYGFSFIPKVQKSTGVYEIKVNSVKAQKAADGYAIFSYIDVSVMKTFFGEQKKSFTIRQMGGSVGNKDQGKSMRMEGAPTLKTGDHLIIFLGKNGRSAVPFIGGESGVLRIEDNPGLGQIVTTYDDLAFTAFDDEKDVFLIRPNFLKTDQNTENREIDDDGNDMTIHPDLDFLNSQPMSLQQFSEALTKHINENGPYEAITYTKNEPTSLIKEATDFSKINVKDLEAKNRSVNQSIKNIEDSDIVQPDEK